jgi:hypothetical protein
MHLSELVETDLQNDRNLVPGLRKSLQIIAGKADIYND